MGVSILVSNFHLIAGGGGGKVDRGCWVFSGENPVVVSIRESFSFWVLEMKSLLRKKNDRHPTPTPVY